MSAIEQDYVAFASAVWGGATDDVFVDLYGEDQSGATFKWVFADEEGGTPLITLDNAAAGNEGVSADYDAGAVHPTSGAIVGMTRILPQINEATLEALDFDGAASVTLFHTLYMTPSGGVKEPVLYGDLTVRKGAPS